MMNEELMTVGVILKFLIGLIGITVTLALLIIGFLKKDSKKLKMAGMLFIATWVILMLLGAIEFIVLN